MAIPDYCDVRAEKYFHTCFVGSSHGEKGTPYRTSWDSTSGALPTTMIKSDYNRPLCAYCGNKGFPIQPFFTGSFEADSDSSVTGYACVCKDAMDLLEIKDQIKALEKIQKEQMNDLVKTLPKVNNKVLRAVVSKKATEIEQEIMHNGETSPSLDSLGIFLG